MFLKNVNLLSETRFAHFKFQAATFQKNFDWTRFLNDEILTFLSNPWIIIRSQDVVFDGSRISERFSIEVWWSSKKCWIPNFRWMSCDSMKQEQNKQSKFQHLKTGFSKLLDSSKERLRERPFDGSRSIEEWRNLKKLLPFIPKLRHVKEWKTICKFWEW